MLTAKEQNALRSERIWKNANGILNVETPYPCKCDPRFDCRCLTFLHAIEEANNYDDVLAIEGNYSCVTFDDGVLRQCWLLVQ